ncbi:hypothetical protein LCGC14_1718080, partial [marine sediment metagenome]
ESLRWSFPSVYPRWWGKLLRPKNKKTRHPIAGGRASGASKFWRLLPLYCASAACSILLLGIILGNENLLMYLHSRHLISISAFSRRPFNNSRLHLLHLTSGILILLWPSPPPFLPSHQHSPATSLSAHQSLSLVAQLPRCCQA